MAIGVTWDLPTAADSEGNEVEVNLKDGNPTPGSDLLIGEHLVVYYSADVPPGSMGMDNCTFYVIVEGQYIMIILSFITIFLMRFGAAGS